MYQSMKDGERQQMQLQRQQDQAQSQQLSLEQQQQLQAENQRLQQQMRQWEQQQRQQQQQAPQQPAPTRQADATRGCPYLIHTEYGLTHAPGSRFCHARRLHICDIAGKDDQGRFLYQWNLSTSGCDSLAPSPAGQESYGARLQKHLKVYEDD